MSQSKEPENIWDGCEQYKKELGHVHAPAELVALTKEKAAEKEERQKRQRRRREMYLPAVAAAAVAVAVLRFPLWRKAPEKGSQEPLQPYLGSAVDTPEKEEEIVVQQTAVLPVEFLQENVWEEDLEGVQVKFVEKDRVCIAVFAGETGYIVVRKETEDLETFRENVRVLIQNGGSVNENRE